MSTGATLSAAQLRDFFLFESLEPDRLEWLAAHGSLEEHPAGSTVYAEGAAATCFFVLVSGTLCMTRLVEGTELEITRTDQRGAYAGAMQSYVRSTEPTRYSSSVHAVTDCTFWTVPADEFGGQIRAWFPMAIHLLEGLMLGIRSTQTVIGARERLLSLGRLSAGLTHELNNPASAAVRATAALRERVSKMRRKLAHLATANLEPEALAALTELQENAVERMVKAEKLSPWEVGEAEDSVGEWLDEHGVTNSWDLAPALVTAGVTEEWLDEIAATVPEDLLNDGIHWVAYALDTEQLMIEIEDSTERISTLVGAAKQYSQLDRAELQDIDIHEGLRSTITMLHYKIKQSGTITLKKDFAEGLPLIPAHPAELNQVWTNLIDNAIHALESQPGGGTLSVRTAVDGNHLLVEIGDTGPGVPEHLQTKIFEPFFTTKAVGDGTGLGLDISYRVVTQRHGGDLRVVSRPGDTRFQVRLPLRGPTVR